MLKLIVFLLSIAFVVAKNPLKLSPLCEERITVDGARVNSFYRIQFTQKLEPIGNFTPNATREYIKIRYHYYDEDFPEFDSVTLDFNKQYKKQLKEIYNENFFNNVNNSQLSDKIREKQALLAYIKEVFRVQKGYINGGMDSQVIKLFDGFIEILGRIRNLTENRLNLKFLPYNKLKAELELLIGDGLSENQVSVFENDFIDVFYEKPLATFDGFKLYRGNQSIFLDENAYGEIFYSFVLPMFDRNYSKNSVLACSSLDSLPKYFSLETMPVEKNQTKIQDSD